MTACTSQGDSKCAHVGSDRPSSEPDLAYIQKWIAMQGDHSRDSVKDTSFDHVPCARGRFFGRLKNEADVGRQVCGFKV